VVKAFVIGCSVLLLVGGCAGTRAGTRSETSKEQGPTEATHKEQTRSPKAAASEEARCERTRTYQKGRVVRGHRNVFTTNDLPDCPKGGLLLGTDKADKLGAKEGGDEIRGLGAADQIFGGVGKDVIYGGPGDDSLLVGDDGADVIYGGDGDDGLDGARDKDVVYGGDGNDSINASGDRGQRDKINCAKGKDTYFAEKIDYVDSTCEKKELGGSA
jgi:RTX calcium-binding nonapeptide repeat (4 copies)